MKKILSIVLVLACMCGAAFADEIATFGLDEIYSCDLDGDGIEESWGMSEAEDINGEPVIRIWVESQDGVRETAVFDIEAWCWYNPQYYLLDLNNDGFQEIVVSAYTSESMGCTTYCLNYAYGRIWEVMFANISPYGGSYDTSFPGIIQGIEDNVITLKSNMNVLGSWDGIWQFTLSEKHRMELYGERWCERYFDTEERDMEFYWEWSDLTLEVETAYRNGEEIGMLYPGDRILITGTDFWNKASFITEDGREGQLYIEPQSRSQFGWFVNSNKAEDFAEAGSGYKLNLIDENEFFASLPYGG